MATDVGTVINPRTLAAQLHGGGIQGFSAALAQKWVYDRRWGLQVSKRFYANRPPTFLDVPHEQPMQWAAQDKPDPFSPVGAKGVGETAEGAGSGAVLCAIADALGDELLQPHAADDRPDPDPDREPAARLLQAGGARLSRGSTRGELTWP